MPTCRHEILKLVSIQSHHHPIKKVEQQKQYENKQKRKKEYTTNHDAIQ